MYDRIKARSHRERLGLDPSGTIQPSQVKKNFHKLALVWHPDNMNKKYRFCFANKPAFTRLVGDIFLLFQESYKVLG